MQLIHDLPQFKARSSTGRGYASAEERNRNLQNDAIAQISSETGWRAEDIGPLYRWVFHELEQGAQVRDYLFVLTAKHVRRALNKRKVAKRKDWIE